MALAPKGIDVRKTTDRIVFRGLLQDTDGAIVVAGNATLYIYELQDDGDLLSYDFDDDTFKAGALTTETVTMVKQTGDNSTTETGIYTYALTTVSGFTDDGVYLARIYHATAVPTDQYREFQFGGAQGDLTLSASGNLDINVAEISDSSTEADRLEAALTTANGIDLNMGQSLPAAPGTADTTGEALSQTAVIQKDQWDRIFSTFGAGANTLIGHLRSMMSKAAATPTGAGTYDPATDSLESAAEVAVAMSGGGFSTGTDSLAAIRAYLESAVAPSIVSSSALSGSGFLSDTVSLLRQMTDEPATSPKYTDSDLVEMVQTAFDTITADMITNTDHPILVRWDMSVVDDTLEYTLPANCTQLWRMAKVNSATRAVEWEVWPGNHWDFAGYGFAIEGNNIRLLRDWGASHTLQVLYVPSSESYIHTGTAGSATDSTIVLAATATDGTLDPRANAYAGYTVRILGGDTGVGEERQISSYDISDRTATLATDWGVTPTGTIVYEVVPQYTRLVKQVVAQRAAIDLLSYEGSTKKMQALERTLASKMRSLRLFMERKQSRFATHLEGDVPDNADRTSYLGE